jgi:hypothetical protein
MPLASSLNTSTARTNSLSMFSTSCNFRFSFSGSMSMHLLYSRCKYSHMYS